MGQGERVIGLGRAGGKGGEKWPGPVRVWAGLRFWAGEKGREGGRVGPLEEKRKLGSAGLLGWIHFFFFFLYFLFLFLSQTQAK